LALLGLGWAYAKFWPLVFMTPHDTQDTNGGKSSTPASPAPGIFFVISAPSGTGKTSLIKGLLAQDPGLSASISMTTRPARQEEVHGADYLFTSTESFTTHVDQGAMLEYAHVFDHSYGTPRNPVEEDIRKGQDVVADLDWQGAFQVQRRYTGGPLVTIFIAPPTLDDLKLRLEKRDQDSPQVIERRLASAKAELAQSRHYDHVIINDDFERTLKELQELINQVRHHHRRRHQHLAVAQTMADQP
jgi:guanylate kinase